MNETHTAELRAKILRDSGFWPRTVRELCDALDQAWAQWRHDRARAEDAADRIAAAVVELDESISVGTGAYLLLAERIRAILLSVETP